MIKSMMLSLLLFDRFITVEALVRPIVAVVVLFFVDHLIITEHFLAALPLERALELKIVEIRSLGFVIEEENEEAEP